MSGKTSPNSRRPFGMLSVTFLIVANMIGAGVFTTSGFSMFSLSREAIMLAWVVGGVIALCGAYSYGLLAKRITESGGEYLFLSRSVHPAIGFIAGWVSLLQGFTGAIAFAAVAFETYALPDSIRPKWYFAGLLPVVAILIFTVLHSIVLRFGLAAQNFVVAAKLILLVVFLGYSAFLIPGGHWQGLSIVESAKPFSILAFATALVYISLSYSGFNAAVYISDEVENAKRNVPLSMILATATVMVIYVLLNFVFVYGATPEAITGEKDIAAIAATSIGGAGFSNLVRFVICLALLSSVSSMIVAGPRVYAKMAEDGVFPKALSFKTNHDSAPAFAIWFQAILACIVVLITSLQQLLELLSFTLSVSAALTVCCLFLSSRSTDKNSSGARKLENAYLGWRIILPVIYVISTLSLGVLFMIDSMNRNQQVFPFPLAAFAATIVSGLILYFVFTRSRDVTLKS